MGFAKTIWTLFVVIVIWLNRLAPCFTPRFETQFVVRNCLLLKFKLARLPMLWIVLLSTVFGCLVARCAAGCAIQPDVLGHVTIPTDWTDIPRSGFAYCSSLSTITIPNSVTSIGVKGFERCFSLTYITIPGTVITIGDAAFAQCDSLSTITIPNSVTSIGANVFLLCHSLATIILPDVNSLTFIGAYALATCFGYGLSLKQGNSPRGLVQCLPCKDKTYITIPDNVTSIGGYTFSECAVSDVVIPNSVTSIGTRAFFPCRRLSTITIPNSVTRIGTFAFSVTNLSAVTIPDSVTMIEQGAFAHSSRLSTITIPKNVTIGDGAFANCGCTESLYNAGTMLSDCFVITQVPTVPPTHIPTAHPTHIPTAHPTQSLPTQFPTAHPTLFPTATPSQTPTTSPTNSFPTVTPTQFPTVAPTQVPTVTPTQVPIATSSLVPTALPTQVPTAPPSNSFPTTTPTQLPTAHPTQMATPTTLTTTPAQPLTTVVVQSTIDSTSQDHVVGLVAAVVVLVVIIAVLVVFVRCFVIRSRRRQDTYSLPPSHEGDGILSRSHVTRRTNNNVHVTNASFSLNPTRVVTSHNYETIDDPTLYMRAGEEASSLREAFDGFGDQDKRVYATLCDRGPNVDTRGYLVPVLHAQGVTTVAATSTATKAKVMYAYADVDLRSTHTTDVSTHVYDTAVDVNFKTRVSK